MLLVGGWDINPHVLISQMVVGVMCQRSWNLHDTLRIYSCMKWNHMLIHETSKKLMSKTLKVTKYLIRFKSVMCYF